MTNDLGSENTEDEKYVLKKVPSVEVLRIAIDEQRRVYDEISNSKHAVAVKTITLAGAGLALLTYLYADGNLFIPDEQYGKIFYFVGALLTLSAISMLLFATKPLGKWMVPTENTRLKELAERDERKYLEYVSKSYTDCFDHNLKHYHHKQRLMNYAFYPLVFGAIILVVIKIFGGQP